MSQDPRVHHGYVYCDEKTGEVYISGTHRRIPVLPEMPSKNAISSLSSINRRNLVPKKCLLILLEEP